MKRQRPDRPIKGQVHAISLRPSDKADGIEATPEKGSFADVDF